MDIKLDHTAVRLAEHDTISIVDGNGARIAVKTGSVWITQEHDARDVILGAGENFILDRDGTAIVESLADAELAIDAPSHCVDPVAAHDPNLTSLAVLGYARHRTRSARWAPGRGLA